jgi:hypothetical protein
MRIIQYYRLTAWEDNGIRTRDHLLKWDNPQPVGPGGNLLEWSFLGALPTELCLP